MEVIFNQQVYPSGTVDVSCRCYAENLGMQQLQSKVSVCKLRSTYKFRYSTNYFSLTPEQLDVTVDSDMVENPKQLDMCDWQLLKILHPEVQHYQWDIFQVMKDFVDNRTEEDYSLQRIKEILQKESRNKPL
ncbi:MAG: hypothetical protein ACRC6V_10475 [Bacteroidales bacterium]